MGELQEGCGMLEVHPSDRTVVVHHEKDDKLMAFDHVFGPTATQLQVYKEMAAPLVEVCPPPPPLSTTCQLDGFLSPRHP